MNVETLNAVPPKRDLGIDKGAGRIITGVFIIRIGPCVTSHQIENHIKKDSDN